MAARKKAARKLGKNPAYGEPYLQTVKALKENLAPQPTTPEDRQSAQAVGNQHDVIVSAARAEERVLEALLKNGKATLVVPQDKTLNELIEEHFQWVRDVLRTHKENLLGRLG